MHERARLAVACSPRLKRGYECRDGCDQQEEREAQLVGAQGAGASRRQGPLARQAQDVVIGDENDGYDDVIAVWYPSAAAFLALATDLEILERRADRVAGLERATILRCDAASEPVLSDT